jgi:hypothetical protein
LHECTKISNHHYPPSPSLNPRFYDRNATGIENVPIFIKADNAENEIESFLANHERYKKCGIIKVDSSYFCEEHRIRDSIRT